MITNFDFGKLNLEDPDFSLQDLAWCVKVRLGNSSLCALIRACLDYLDEDPITSTNHDPQPSL